MSKVEPEEFLNDRYKAIEQRLAVSSCSIFDQNLRFATDRSICFFSDRPQEAQPAPDLGREGACSSGVGFSLPVQGPLMLISLPTGMAGCLWTFG